MEDISNQDELLQYAIRNGMINLSYVQEQIEMAKREELLKKHPYSIWEGKDGKWRTYVPDDKKGRILKKRNSQEEIEKIVIDYLKQVEENPTIKDVFTEWNDRKLQLGQISRATHMRNIQMYNRHYADIEHRKIKSFSCNELSDFLEEQISKCNLTAKGFSGLKTITRGFLKRAKKRKLINFNVEDIFSEMDLSEKIFKKNIKDDCEEVFDKKEFEVVVEYLNENPDVMNLGILLLFFTGLRVGELVALKWSDINNGCITISRTETRYVNENGEYIYDIKDSPKTLAGFRDVVIPKDYLWIVKKLRLINPFSEFVFENKKHVRIHTSQIRKRLYYICKKLGIYQKSPHKIRKTYCSILLDNNVDQRLILSQVGHTNIMTTENAYHRNRRNKQERAEILSKLPELKVRY